MIPTNAKNMVTLTTSHFPHHTSEFVPQRSPLLGNRRRKQHSNTIWPYNMPRVVVEDSDDELPELGSLLKTWDEERTTRTKKMTEQPCAGPKLTARRTRGAQSAPASTSVKEDAAFSEEGELERCVNAKSLNVEPKKVRKRVLNAKAVANPLLRPLSLVEDDLREVKSSKSNSGGIKPYGNQLGFGQTTSGVEQHGIMDDMKQNKRLVGKTTIKRTMKQQLMNSSYVSIAREIPDSESDGQQNSPSPHRNAKPSQNNSLELEGIRRRSIPEKEVFEILPSLQVKPRTRTYGKQHSPIKKAALKGQYTISDDHAMFSNTESATTPDKGVSKDSVEPITARKMREETMKGMVAKKRAEEPTRYRPQTPPSERGDSDYECSKIEFDVSESDDMSDFIVNDNHVSGGEDSGHAFTPPPPPRSTRKLVQGRKPQISDKRKATDVSLEQGTQSGKLQNIVLENERESVKLTDIDAFSSGVDEGNSGTPQPKKVSDRHGGQLLLDLAGLSLDDE